jgi:hypothetical protein
MRRTDVVASDAEDRADLREVVVDAVPPVVVDRFAEPGAGLVLGRGGQFGEVVDGGFDDTHGSGLPCGAGVMFEDGEFVV